MKSENCHANMVYGYIHEYKHQNSIQYIVPEKKEPPISGPFEVGLKFGVFPKYRLMAKDETSCLTISGQFSEKCYGTFRSYMTYL